MSVNSIQGYGAAAVSAANNTPVPEKAASAAESSGASSSTFDETAVVYEKSAEAAQAADANVTEKKDRSAIIAQLKADADARNQQLMGIVQKMMLQQGKTIGTADSMWAFLAGGDFTVSADVKAQAQADIAEDGYWGVEQTSDRILDFAKALAGDDPDKADELLDAFKKGFKQATKSWGKDLPDLSQRTYEAVEKKFEDWKKSADKTAEETADSTAAETEV